MQLDDADTFIERIAEAVVRKIDEREKINMIAQAVLWRLREMDVSARQAWRVPESVPPFAESLQRDETAAATSVRLSSATEVAPANSTNQIRKGDEEEFVHGGHCPRQCSETAKRWGRHFAAGFCAPRRTNSSLLPVRGFGA